MVVSPSGSKIGNVVVSPSGSEIGNVVVSPRGSEIGSVLVSPVGGSFVGSGSVVVAPPKLGSSCNAVVVIGSDVVVAPASGSSGNVVVIGARVVVHGAASFLMHVVQFATCGLKAMSRVPEYVQQPAATVVVPTSKELHPQRESHCCAHDLGVKASAVLLPLLLRMFAVLWV